MNAVAEMIDIHVEQINSVIVVELAGELDSYSAPEAQAGILPLIDRGSRVLLDMSRVTYMSSAGIRTLLLLYRTISEKVGKIVMTGLTDEVKEIMSLTGFLDFFSVFESRKEGLTALS